jgi:hypothetical protein
MLLVEDRHANALATATHSARLGSLAARFTRDGLKKPQVNTPVSPLEQLPGHHHALDLVGALIDLGDLSVPVHHP